MGSAEVMDIGAETLTDDQWKEIRTIAQQIYDQGRFGGNQMKCTVSAFIMWVAIQEHLIVSAEQSLSREAALH